MASLPQPPLPAQNHHHVINSLHKKTKSPTCVQTKLCADCLVKISSKPTAFSHLMMFIANLLQPKICTFSDIFFAKNILKKPTFLFGTNRSQRCILLFSSLKKITTFINHQIPTMLHHKITTCVHLQSHCSTTAPT